MRQVLQELGVEDPFMSIFASDGEDTDPDLAIQRSEKRPEHWLFRFRRELRFFPRKPTLINSSIKGTRLHEAKRSVLVKEMKRVHKTLKDDGKPLFVFVTDHGTRNRRLRHTRNQRISLWYESLSVQQYQLMMRRFSKRKVVSVMSQCFSGSFAWSIFRKPGRFGIPTGDQCGFYATLPNRYSYGCFPETKLKKSVGHAYRFIHAMRQARTFNEAHKQVLLTDVTPDVPNRSSDGYLYFFLKGDAKADGVKPHVYVDRILKRFEGKSYPGMKEDLSVLSAVAQRFSLARPLNLSALRAQRKSLNKRLRWFRRVERMWRSVFSTARSHHLDGWLKETPMLRGEVKYLLKNLHLLKKSKKQRKAERRKRLKRRLANAWKRARLWKKYRKLSKEVKDLRGMLKKVRGTKRKRRYRRLTKAQRLKAWRDRQFERTRRKLRRRYNRRRWRNRRRRNRRGRARRMRNLRKLRNRILRKGKRLHWPVERIVDTLRKGFLTYVDSRPQLKSRLQLLYSRVEEMKKHVFRLKVQRAALKRMELLLYRIAGRKLLYLDKDPEYQAHHQGLQRLLGCEQTPLSNEPQLADTKLAAPKPMSFSLKNVPLPSWFGISFRPAHKRHPELPTGAIEIQNVYLNTPAKASGLMTGDMIVAVGGRQLREPYEIRERVMLAKPEQPVLMRIIRKGHILDLPVRLKRLVSPPTMKLPPIIGRKLPGLSSLELLSKQSKLPNLDKDTVLVFFWATWCGPCKAALPTMRRWKQKYASRGLRIVTVSNEKAHTIVRWLKSHPRDMPFYNARDKKRGLSRKMRVRATPTFVILKRGKIKLYHVGSRGLGGFEKKFLRFLR